MQAICRLELSSLPAVYHLTVVLGTSGCILPGTRIGKKLFIDMFWRLLKKQSHPLKIHVFTHCIYSQAGEGKFCENCNAFATMPHLCPASMALTRYVPHSVTNGFSRLEDVIIGPIAMPVFLVVLRKSLCCGGRGFLWVLGIIQEVLTRQSNENSPITPVFISSQNNTVILVGTGCIGYIRVVVFGRLSLDVWIIIRLKMSSIFS